MNDQFKKYLISIAITFSSSFLTTVGALILTVNPVDITWSAIAALIITAARTALKAAVEGFVPQRLGGRKVV